VVVVTVEVGEGGVDVAENPVDPFVGAQFVAGKDFVGGVDVTEAADVPIEAGGVFFLEEVAVAFEEEHPLAVEGAHVVFDDFDVAGRGCALRWRGRERW